jgi:hypothetical protein
MNDDFEEYKGSTRDINVVNNGNQYVINNPQIEIIGDASASKNVEIKVKEFEKVDYLRLLDENCNKKHIVYRKKLLKK